MGVAQPMLHDVTRRHINSPWNLTTLVMLVHFWVCCLQVNCRWISATKLSEGSCLRGENVNYGKLLERWKALCFVQIPTSRIGGRFEHWWTCCDDVTKLPIGTKLLDWMGLLILTFEQIKLFSKLPACSLMKAVYARLCMLLVGLLHQMAYKLQASENNWICRLVWYGLTISLYLRDLGPCVKMLHVPCWKLALLMGKRFFTVATAVSLGSTCCSGQWDRCRPSVEFSITN